MISPCFISQGFSGLEEQHGHELITDKHLPSPGCAGRKRSGFSLPGEVQQHLCGRHTRALTHFCRLLTCSFTHDIPYRLFSMSNPVPWQPEPPSSPARQAVHRSAIAFPLTKCPSFLWLSRKERHLFLFLHLP